MVAINAMIVAEGKIEKEGRRVYHLEDFVLT